MLRLSQSKIKEILDLREEGYKYIDIMSRCDVSYCTVASYCSRYRPNLKTIATPNKYSLYVDQVTLLRRRGNSILEISQKVKLSPTTVRKICSTYCPGLKNIAQRKITERQEREIVQYHKYKYTNKQIANIVHVDITTVRKVLNNYK